MLTSDQIYIGALIRYNKFGHRRYGFLAKVVSLDGYNAGGTMLGVRFMNQNYVESNYTLIFADKFEPVEP